ncbi:putative NAD dependent epimerase/dehydratase [Seiridium cardinale]|uniref:NAD dependent epimerase/dehydratase n=1 Tax=Seiridium cardinale TaxID=138064 RepID=A0ABR2XH65_9PEZI
MTRVLLTGGTGFLASHILRLLLERGYNVTITVRSKKSGDGIVQRYSHLGPERLQYVIVEDIARLETVENVIQTLEGLDYVIHTASPFTQNFKDPVGDMIDPAVKGTISVLRAVKVYAPTVKRVVLTSSFVAMFNPQAGIKVYDESCWSSVTREDGIANPRATYTASKLLAEKVAWDFMETEAPGFDIVALNPPLIFGPVVEHLQSLDHVNTSNQRIRDIALGRFVNTALPPTGIFLWADVRDVAMAHVRALEVQAAGGQRFLITQGHYSNKAIAEAIKTSRPDLASKLPNHLVDDTPPGIYGYSNQKAVQVLGLEFKSLDECIADTVKSFNRFGI